jgi:hypothetical protein
LSCGVPKLHGDESVVYEYFFCEEIGADRGFVGCAELLVDLERGVLGGWEE